MNDRESAGSGGLEGRLQRQDSGREGAAANNSRLGRASGALYRSGPALWDTRGKCQIRDGSIKRPVKLAPARYEATSSPGQARSSTPDAGLLSSNSSNFGDHRR